MSNEIVLVELEQIQDNPYQMRADYDAGKIKELALDIATNSLLQVPAARQVNGHYELVYGHRRKRAYELLATAGVPEMGIAPDLKYKFMPLVVRELDDFQMFDDGLSENLKRDDLKPTERARALKQYLDFGKTSKEAAIKFGLGSDATVRGLVRLLDLPDEAQTALDGGKITQGTARNLLTVQKVGGAEAVHIAMVDLKTEQFSDPDDAVEHAIESARDAQRMDYRLPWAGVEKFPVKYLPALNQSAVAKLLITDKQNGAQKELLNGVMRRIEKGEEISDADFPSFQPDQLEKVRILVNAPACNTCSLHVKLNGTDYCGMKLCYERKSIAWAQAEVNKVSKDTGIKLYVNEATDGKAIELNGWDTADRKLFEDKHPDLRLKATTRAIWSNFGSLPRNVVLVVVGKTAEKRLKAQEKVTEKEDGEREDRLLKSKIRDLRNQFMVRFTWNVMTPAFESLLDGLTNLPFMLFWFKEAMSNMADLPEGVDDQEEQINQLEKSKKKADALKQLRRLMVLEVIDRALEWDDYSQYGNAKKPFNEMVEKAQEWAKEWGVKLPKDVNSQAENYQTDLEAAMKELRQAVFAETKGRKS